MCQKIYIFWQTQIKEALHVQKKFNYKKHLFYPQCFDQQDTRNRQALKWISWHLQHQVVNPAWCPNMVLNMLLHSTCFRHFDPRCQLPPWSNYIRCRFWIWQFGCTGGEAYANGEPKTECFLFIPFSACFIIYSLLSFFHHSFLLSFFHHSSLLSFFHNSFPTQLFSSFVPVQLFFIIHSLLSCFHYSLSAHSAFFIIHSLLSFFKIHSLLSFNHHSFPAQLFSSFILFLAFS